MIRTTKRLPAAGYTLIESIVSMAISMIVLFGVGTGLVFALRQDSEYLEKADALEKLSIAARIMEARIRLGKSITEDPSRGERRYIVSYPDHISGVAFGLGVHKEVSEYHLVQRGDGDLEHEIVMPDRTVETMLLLENDLSRNELDVTITIETSRVHGQSDALALLILSTVHGDGADREVLETRRWVQLMNHDM